MSSHTSLTRLGRIGWALAAIALSMPLGSCGSSSPGNPSGALSCGVSPTSGEAPLTATFTATASDAADRDFHWVFSDGTAAPGRIVTRTFLRGGIFSGQVTNTLTGETCSTGKLAVGTAISLHCSANPDQLIVPNEVQFGADASGGDGTFSYAWDFGDGQTSTQKDPVHPYHSAGTYPARVTATSAGLSATCARDVRAFDGGLVVSCSADPTEGAEPLTVQFRAEATGGSGTYTYDWQFGDGGSATSKAPTHTYVKHGIFETQVTVGSAAAAGVCRQTIYVGRTPVCGDGIRDPPNEACDDGNTTSGDGCSGSCDTVEHGFICTGTRSTCYSTCGDGLVAKNEGCDDGGTTAGDGCSATCTVEHAFTCSGEPSACSATCGDGLVASTEQCDDKNTTAGDGCDATCNIEAGFTCTGEPSVCK